MDTFTLCQKLQLWWEDPPLLPPTLQGHATLSVQSVDWRFSRWVSIVPSRGGDLVPADCGSRCVRTTHSWSIHWAELASPLPHWFAPWELVLCFSFFEPGVDLALWSLWHLVWSLEPSIIFRAASGDNYSFLFLQSIHNVVSGDGRSNNILRGHLVSARLRLLMLWLLNFCREWFMDRAGIRLARALKRFTAADRLFVATSHGALIVHNLRVWRYPDALVFRNEQKLLLTPTMDGCPHRGLIIFHFLFSRDADWRLSVIEWCVSLFFIWAFSAHYVSARNWNAPLLLSWWRDIVRAEV